MIRKKITVFSLSFIDCVCCGLGAIILLFVIVNAKGALRRDEVTAQLRADVARREKEVLDQRKGLVEARNALQTIIEEISRTQGLSRNLIKAIDERRIELAQYENQTLATKEHLKRLKTDLKSTEEEFRRLEAGSKTQDDYGDRLRSFPGEGDRQYLTDLKLGGDRIFILVDASASMLDDTIVEIIRRRNLRDEDKLRSQKWRQAVSTIDWLATQLPQNSKFQAYVFNETARPLIDGTEGAWLSAGDPDRLQATIDGLRRVVPQKGTSLLNAFEALAAMKPAPDNILLLTDGLPTMGSVKPWGNRVSGKKRLSLFNDAARRLPPKVPINVILYPLEGDPMAASAFWRLAAQTDGSFLCPSRDWP